MRSVNDLPDSVARSVRSFKVRTKFDSDGNAYTEVEVAMWDKVAALQLLGRHLGMFQTGLNVDGTPETFLESLLQHVEKQRMEYIDSDVIESKANGSDSVG